MLHKIPAMKINYLLLFSALIGPGFSDSSSQHVLDEEPKRQYYICDDCVPRELVHAPGIGFDLSSGYGTAAIRYHNGTVFDIGRVDGSTEYKEFMERLSVPYKHYGPPFESPLDQVEYDLDQAKRYIRKRRGLPSTEDISTLAGLLTQIKYLVAREHHIVAHRIVLSLPTMPNFQSDDLAEALEIAGLTQLESFRHYRAALRNMNAAWAGMGLGLCEHWQDIQMCDEEMRHIKPKKTLVLTYTYDELSVEIGYIVNAHRSFPTTRFRFPDLSYGTWDNDRSNTTYWETIGRRVVEVYRRGPGSSIEALVLMGEYAEEKRFLDSIWKAIGGDLGLDVQKLWVNFQRPDFKAEFVAARGAAEMAKRWQGETWGCVEGDWCKGNRDYME